MPKVNPEIESFARIKVVGVGGSGKGALNHMINSKVKAVEFVAVNTDVQDLHNCLAEKKIHIGKNLTKGLGSGMNPEIGKRAAEETKEECQPGNVKGAHLRRCEIAQLDASRLVLNFHFSPLDSVLVALSD